MTDAFPRTWRQTALIVPLARALKRYYRPRAHGLEPSRADLPVVYVAKHPRTWLYLETMVFGLFAFWDAPDRIRHPRDGEEGTSVHRLPLVGWVRANVGAHRGDRGGRARGAPARASRSWSSPAARGSSTARRT